MQDDKSRDRLLTRFLLGQLSEEERDYLEERLFADDALFERLQICESELFDSYVRNELSQEDRERFESLFLGGPGAQGEIAFARVLARRASLVPAVPEPAPWWRPAFGWFGGQRLIVRVGFAAAAVALVLSPLLFLREGAQTPRQLAQRAEPPGAVHSPPAGEPGARSEARPPEASPSPAGPQARGTRPRPVPAGAATREREPQQLREPPARPTEEAGVTIARALSGSGIDTLDLPHGEHTVRLELELAGELTEPADTRGERAYSRSLQPDANRYRGFLATLQAANGRQILESENLRAGLATGTRRPVSLEVPSRLLVPGEYVLRLRGVRPNGIVEPVRVYRFRVGR